MSSGLNWAQASQRDKLNSAPAPRAFRPITEKQVRFLASLQHQLDEPYIGDGLSVGEAKVAIDDCLRRLGGARRKRAPRRVPRTPLEPGDLRPVFAVDCPRCKAVPSEPCVDRSGSAVQPHASRKREAKRVAVEG